MMPKKLTVTGHKYFCFLFWNHEKKVNEEQKLCYEKCLHDTSIDFGIWSVPVWQDWLVKLMVFFVSSKNRHVCANSSPLAPCVITSLQLPWSAVFCCFTVTWRGQGRRDAWDYCECKYCSICRREAVATQSNLYKHVKKSRKRNEE